ncbi:Zn-dependent dipeptidase, microsomal dipeptidase [Desulfosporosinus orientis DSM 765]|uniref:Zn-dependent dipeptidase, microsomal dipeptidase n=1 Tax=Desulfosporosinus orientis (strain ATCC 19365 / DSM 765 / NCIMB 8382 / VKM B-1628 / Singapore I) TaxID=768706 RepID=G7WGV1_DESOD|nr:dipeptidase [Desulfosporosinus orientis]AET68965.1 Zn-dependent dipeptidase, microsomal dipeptidase [Desulfosporosinus orientis DSM 765]
MSEFSIIDGHCDSLLDFVNGKRTLLAPSEGGHWDTSRARSAGVALQFLAAFIETRYKPSLATQRGLELIDGARRFIAGHGDQVFQVLEKEDLRGIPDPSRIGIILSVEGGEILGDQLFMLDTIYHLGVRALGITWNQRNALADGVGEKTQSRLTNLGQQVILRMNELGMLIDVSHLNEAGFWHVLELSQDPIAATHSCAKALCDHPRNLTDQQLRALSKHGGVVGVNFYPSFLTQTGQAELKDVVRHICHIAEVAGVETVSLGSDFDGITEVPKGLEHVGDFGSLVDELLKAGFSTQEVDKICSGNFMRLLSKVLK